MGAYRPGDIADPGAAPGLWQKDSAGIFENVYNSQYTAQYDWPVPRLVDDLACRGDPVCRELLGKLGAVQGEILAG